MPLKSFAEQLVNEAINAAEDVAASAGADAGAAARTALPGAQDAHDDATIAFEVLVSVVRDATGWSHDDESPKERLFGAKAAKPGSLWSHDDESPKERLFGAKAAKPGSLWSHDDESPKERLFGAKAAKPGSLWSHDDEAPKERLFGAKAAKPGSWWSHDDEAPKERLFGAKAAKPGSWWSDDESPKERPFGPKAAKPGPGWGDDEGPEESHLEEKAAVVAVCVAIAGTLVGAEPADVGALLRAALDIREMGRWGSHRAAKLHRLQHVSGHLRILRAQRTQRARGSAKRWTAFLALLTEAEYRLSVLAPQRTGMRQLPHVALVDRFRHAMKRSIVTAGARLPGTR